MPGVMGAFKIEKRFYGDLPPDNVGLAFSKNHVDTWFMEFIDKTLKSKEIEKTLILAQIVEITKAWKNVKKTLDSMIPTVRIVLE